MQKRDPVHRAISVRAIQRRNAAGISQPLAARNSVSRPEAGEFYTPARPQDVRIDAADW